MKLLLIKKLRIPSVKIEVLPFFNMPDQIEPVSICKNLNSFIYPSTGLSHKNHAVLLKAWDLLFQEGYNFELHLTISESDIKLIRNINNLKSRGLNIINHGIITDPELLTLYKMTEYLVYPSLNESFGLPLLEAVQQNCMIITADLPYSREAVIPTSVFNPYRPSSLKSAILQTISHKGIEKKSMIITENKIDSFIELINKYYNT
jgi:glycosyltransferase involved in cell wall biosynthesis